MRTRSDSVSSIISSISDISFVQGVNHSADRKVSSRKSIYQTFFTKLRVVRWLYNSGSVVDLHGMWYPTVRSSIMCLSKLYRSLDVRIYWLQFYLSIEHDFILLLQKRTFQGISQDVLFACIASLEVAYNQIKHRKVFPFTAVVLLNPKGISHFAHRLQSMRTCSSLSIYWLFESKSPHFTLRRPWRRSTWTLQRPNVSSPCFGFTANKFNFL